MKRKQILIFALVVCLLAGILTFAMSAAEKSIQAEENSAKNITLAAEAIYGDRQSNVYFGTYPQSLLGRNPAGTEHIDYEYSVDAALNGWGPYYKRDAVKWRVLDTAFDYNNDKQANTVDATTGILLLSDKNLDIARYNDTEKNHVNITYEKSTVRSWINGYAAKENSEEKDYSTDNFINSVFKTGEREGMFDTVVVNKSSEKYDTPAGSNTKDKVFLLSYDEVNAYFADDTERIAQNTDYIMDGGTIGEARLHDRGPAGAWYLRSPGESADYVLSVWSNGQFLSTYSNNSLVTVRPAFNLNPASILFTSKAVGGKSNNIGADLTKNESYTENDYKLTMLDSKRRFNIPKSNAPFRQKAGDSISLTYEGAQTGDNEYISAIISDSDQNVLYYGHVANPATANGTVTFNVPPDIKEGEYKLSLFNEQVNGDCKTDFSSAFQSFSLNIVKEAGADDFTFTPPDNLTYDGRGKAVTITSKKTGTGNITVKYYKDGVRVDSPVDAGTYTVKIDVTDGDIYLGNTDISNAGWQFTIAKKDIKDARIDLKNTLTYNGEEQTQEVSDVMAGELALPDYTVSGNKQTAAGNYTLTVKAADGGNFTGTAKTAYSISPLRVEVEWSGDTEFIYNGQEHGVTANVTNKKGRDAVDLEITEDKASDAGSYTARITAAKNGNYTVDGAKNLTKDWKIKPKDISRANVTLADELTYNGKVQAQKVETVEVDGMTLSEKDYMLTGSEGKAAGQYKLSITGSGNFTGTVQKDFNIEKLPVVISWKGADGLVYNEKVQTVVPVIENVCEGDKMEPVIEGEVSAVNKGTYSASVVGIEEAGIKILEENSLNYTLTEGTNLKKTWEILPAVPVENDTKKTAVNIQKGMQLYQADITEGEFFDINQKPLKGSFAWENPTKIIEANSKETIIFTPDNTNYAPVNIEVDITVDSSTDTGEDENINEETHKDNGKNSDKTASKVADGASGINTTIKEGGIMTNDAHVLNEKKPATGDSSNTVIWIVVAAAAVGAGVVGMILYKKK